MYSAHRFCGLETQIGNILGGWVACALWSLGFREKTQELGAVGSWGLESSEASIPRRLGGCYWTVGWDLSCWDCWQGHLHTPFPHGLDSPCTQWLGSRLNSPRYQVEAVLPLSVHPSRLTTQWYFYRVLSIETIAKAFWVSGGEE